MRRLLPELDANGWRLVAAKIFRGYAFGLNAVVLGLYLADLQLAPEVIGLILSAALLGTLGLTLLIALFGDRIGRRRLLVVGSGLMLLAAIIPLVGANPVVLALIGLSGMVAVTSSESTGLQSVDQAALPQTVPAAQRTAAFALYNLVAAAASALGALSVGPFVALGIALNLPGAMVHAPAFVAYAAAGLISTLLTLSLDGRVEERDHLLLVGRRVAEAHAHTAKPEGRDLQAAGSERSFLHGVPPYNERGTRLIVTALTSGPTTLPTILGPYRAYFAW